jgi:hypothetical protein
MTLAGRLDERKRRQKEDMLAEKERQEMEAIKTIYPKYLDGNADGDVDGFLNEVTQRVGYEKSFALRKEFSTLAELKAKQRETEQGMQRSQQAGYEYTNLSNQLLPPMPNPGVPADAYSSTTPDPVKRLYSGIENEQAGRPYGAQMPADPSAPVIPPSPPEASMPVNISEDQWNKYRMLAPYDKGINALVEQHDKKISGSGSGLSGWKEKIKERDAITSGISPYTGAPIKTEDELNTAWDMWEKTWATTPALAITPKYIEGAAKRAGATGYSGRRGSIGAEQDVGGVNPVIADRTSKMRDEFINLPEVKTAKTISQNYKKAKQAYADYKAGKTSAYNVDQSLGYFASKALDPNSVVMPGEFDRFAKGLGVAEGAEAMVKKLISGGLKLTDAQREAMMQIVENASSQAINAAKEQYTEYNRLSKQYNLAPDDVTGSLRYIVGQGRSPVKVGRFTIEEE